MLRDIVHLNTESVVNVISHEDGVQIVEWPASRLEVFLIDSWISDRPLCRGFGLKFLSREEHCGLDDVLYNHLMPVLHIVLNQIDD